jgi:uncharacterized protein YbaP (TraB family)
MKILRLKNFIHNTYNQLLKLQFMRALFVSISLLIAFASFGQNNTKSLMYRISGNDLQKPSYIYGTMHVSEKVAFHLGIEFFQALDSADVVAFESNPIIWLDKITNSELASNYIGTFGIGDQYDNGFYKNAFKINEVDNSSYASAISSDHYFMNWLLYRENKSRNDFEEETFLDMFIYQVGAKEGKTLISLEQFAQSAEFSRLSALPDMEDKEQDAWFKDLLKEKRYGDLLEEAYRNRDIALIDSMQQQVVSDNYYHYMLLERNIIMANAIDSVIKSGNLSLFSGVGAAHLAGERGILKLLEEKGYTITAVSTTITDEARNLREAYSDKKVKVPFKYDYESDLFSVTAQNKVYETPYLSNQRQFFSPELTNGSFVTIKQLSTYAYFHGTSKTDYKMKIDSLLFENIPGKIISKEFSKLGEYDAIDVLNETKTGNFQRFKFVVTPIHIFIFKMGGKDEYIKTDSDPFFNSIKVKPLSNEWLTVESKKGDFSIQTPSYHSIKNTQKITSLYGHVSIEAFDPADQNYYYMKRDWYSDFEYIEEDEFELLRIADKFCKEFDIDTVDKTMTQHQGYPAVLASADTKDGKKIYLKIIAKGPFYYLLANVSPTAKTENKFFDSFQFKAFKYEFEFKEKVDTFNHFSVTSNYLIPDPYTPLIRKAYADKRNKNNTKDEEYLEDNKTVTYFSENWECIQVHFTKFHYYDQYLHIDSLWKAVIDHASDENGLILYSKKTAQEDGLYTMDALMTDTNSARTIKLRYILKGGMLYTLQTNGDTLSDDTKFVKEFYSSFKPIGENIGRSVLTDKPAAFFKAINGTDSLERERALSSIERYIYFEDKDAPMIMETLSKYKFPEKQIKAKESLIEDLGRLDNDEIVPYLKDLYYKMEDTSMYQLAILYALTRQHDKDANKLVIDLLERDIPLSGSTYGYKAFYSPLHDSLPLATVMFPSLLEFNFIDEYKSSNLSLLSHLLNEEKIKPKLYKGYVKQLLREAKIELKKQLSSEQAAQSKQNNRYYYSSYKNKGNYLLYNYINVLMPYYKKAEVQEFFEKMKRAQDYKVLTYLYCKMVQYDIDVDPEIWTFLAEDMINREYLYMKLGLIDRQDLFPEAYRKQEMIFESILYESGYNVETDSIIFLEKRLVNVKGKEGYVYFFKSKKKSQDKWYLDYIGIHVEGAEKFTTEKIVSDKGNRITKAKPVDEMMDEMVRIINVEGRKRANEQEDNRYGYGFY